MTEVLNVIMMLEGSIKNIQKLSIDDPCDRDIEEREESHNLWKVEFGAGNVQFLCLCKCELKRPGNW